MVGDGRHTSVGAQRLAILVREEPDNALAPKHFSKVHGCSCPLSSEFAISRSRQRSLLAASWRRRGGAAEKECLDPQETASILDPFKGAQSG